MFGFFRKTKSLITKREVEINYYDDGLTISSVYIVDNMGRMAGACERFYPNGRIKERCRYQAGSPVGPFVKYYENGLIQKRGTFDSKGRLTGTYTHYYPDGQIFFSCNHHKGRKEGLFISYYQNGQVMRRCFYQKNKMNGEYVVYNPKGKIIRQGVYHQMKEEENERDQPLRLEVCRLLNQVNQQMEPCPLRRFAKIGLVNRYRAGYVRE